MCFVDQSFCGIDRLGKITGLPPPAISNHPAVHDLEREFPDITDPIRIFERMLRAIITIPGLRHEPKGLRILPDVMCSYPERAQARNFPEIFELFFYQRRVF